MKIGGGGGGCEGRRMHRVGSTKGKKGARLGEKRGVNRSYAQKEGCQGREKKQVIRKGENKKEEEKGT